jgi:thioredoxin 2
MPEHRTDLARTILSCPSCGRRNRVGPVPRGVPRCAGCHAPLPWIVEAGAESFEREIAASVPVVIDFWAPWCGPCRMVSPVLERLTAARAGKLKLVEVNVDDAPELAARYGAQSIPLLVLVREGRELDRLVGARPQQQLEAWLGREVDR